MSADLVVCRWCRRPYSPAIFGSCRPCADAEPIVAAHRERMEQTWAERRERERRELAWWTEIESADATPPGPEAEP